MKQLATGSVRPIDLTVGAVQHVPEKLAGSLERLKQEAAAGRQVVLALPAANAGDVAPALSAELAADGIAVHALAHAAPLLELLAVPLPPAPAKSVAKSAAAPRPPARRRALAWGALAAALVCGAAGAAILLARQPSSAVSPKPAARLASIPAPRRPLAPELVPFVSERARTVIRDVYVPAPPYKALAVGLEFMGFVSGQPTQKMADDGAVDACTKRTDAIYAGRGVKSPRVCEVYASGNLVVTKRAQPPLPPAPWLIRDPSLERPFVAADLPLVSAALKQQAAEFYPRLRKSKAFAISPLGAHSHFSRQPSPEEAIRRALERCGYDAGVFCMIVAIDDAFVVPIPTLVKVVGFYRPAALTVVSSSLREDLARRLANATSGWNAVAIGAGGRAGVKLGAPSEQAAIEAALEACRVQDRDCRLAVLGPFLVEYEPERAAERKL